MRHLASLSRELAGQPIPPGAFRLAEELLRGLEAIELSSWERSLALEVLTHRSKLRALVASNSATPWPRELFATIASVLDRANEQPSQVSQRPPADTSAQEGTSPKAWPTAADFVDAGRAGRDDVAEDAGPQPEEVAFDSASVRSLRSSGADVLVLVATQVEFKSVLKLLTPLTPRARVLHFYEGDVGYYGGRIETATAIVVMSRMSSSAAGGSSDVASRAIELFRPAAVISVGIAFGADPQKQSIFDILVALQIADYEQQRVQAGGPVFRGPRPETGPLLGNMVRAITNWTPSTPSGQPARIHTGLVLSGQKLLDDQTAKAELFAKFPDAIGGEMEATGIYAACRGHGVQEWIVIKAICDWADGRKSKEFQEGAASTAASLVAYLLSSDVRVDALRKKRSGPSRLVNPSRRPLGIAIVLIILGVVLSLALGALWMRERSRSAALHELGEARRELWSGGATRGVAASFDRAREALLAEGLEFNAAEALCEGAEVRQSTDPEAAAADFRSVVQTAIRLHARPLEGKATHGLALIRFEQRRLEAAQSFSRQSLALLEGSEDHSVRLRALTLNGMIEAETSTTEAWQAEFQRAERECVSPIDVVACRAFLRQRFGAALLARGQAPAAASVTREALKIAREQPLLPQPTLSGILNQLASAELQIGTATAAGAHAAEALKEASESGDHRAAAVAHRLMGTVSLWHGDVEASLRQYEEARELSQRARDPLGVARADLLLGEAHLDLENFASASAELERACSAFERLGYMLSQAECLSVQSQLDLLIGSVDAAQERARRALEISQAEQSPGAAAFANYRLGQVLGRKGQWAEAASYFAAVETFATGTGSRQLLALAKAGIAESVLHSGSATAAADVAGIAASLFRDTTDRKGEASALRLMGDALRKAGRPEQATEAYHSALGVSAASRDGRGFQCTEERLGRLFCGSGGRASP